MMRWHDDEVEAFLGAARKPFADAESGKAAARERLERTLGSVASSPPRQPAIHRWRTATIAAGAFALGVAAHAEYEVASAGPGVPTPAGTVSVVVAAPATLPSVSSKESAWTEVAPAPVVARSTAAAAPSPTPTEPRGDLARERVLLEAARTALERNDPTHALEALERHRSRFRDGQLREEREALEVYALVAAGRADEARQKTVSFHRAFPASLQGGALEALFDSGR